MSEKDPEDREEYLRNTHDAYRLFYTVLMTIGLTQGFNSLLSEVRGVSVSNLGSELQTILTFVVFIFVVLRFFLGGVRHLDTTYLETEFSEITESRVSSQRFRAVDIGLLSFDAGIVIVLGALLTNPQGFFAVLTVLLLVDAVWALLISFQMNELTKQGELTTQIKWGINNAVHVFLFIVVLMFASWPFLIVLGLTNSIVDVWWTFDSYFPPL